MISEWKEKKIHVNEKEMGIRIHQKGLKRRRGTARKRRKKTIKVGVLDQLLLMGTIH